MIESQLAMTNIQLTNEEIQEYTEAFAVFDKDRDGSITVREVRSVMESFGQEATDTQLENMIKEVDLDGNGKIELEEFLTEVPKIKRRAEIKEAFSLFDTNKDGKIGSKELSHALLNLVKGTPEREITELLQNADMKGDGQIYYEELIKLMIP